MMETIVIALLAGALGAALMHIFIGKQQTPPSPAPVVIQLPRQLRALDSPYDLWKLEVVPEREAPQLIRRAKRQNYDVLRYMSDQAGKIYILFQLRPERIYSTYNSNSGLTYKAGMV